METRTPHPPPTGRQEARARLRRAAKRLEREGADLLERHPYEALAAALMAGWLLSRYPGLGRFLLKLLV
ncbi:MAG: hypothetical protein SFU83_18755 [Meiothermus sp.]|nr:hypothetical protein [Meiothermus sp.]